MSELAERFRDAFGTAPEGVWAAPGRVNLIGEHTDYNDGFVLPFALAERTSAAVARRSDDLVDIRSTQESEGTQVRLGQLEKGSPGGWSAYVAGVVWAMREAGHTIPGLSVLVDGHVPLGSGLSSSAALECSFATAVRDLCAPDIDDREIARFCQRAENDFVGAPTGVMDQYASMLCTDGHALFLDVRSRDVEQVPFDPPAHGAALLVINTNVAHSHAGNAYGERRRDCEEAARELGIPSLRDIAVEQLDEALADVGEKRRPRVRHIVTENARVLATVEALRADDFEQVGRLMTESHRSLQYDYEVSCMELDVAVDAALRAGALGARMTGGGFGGCAIALLPTDRTQAVVEAVDADFTKEELRAATMWDVRPSPGAERVE